MKYLNFMITFLLSYLNVFSQTSKEVLSIGDFVPDIKFSNIINYHKTETQLSELKGKLIILDFWASWCIACTRALPLLDSIQEAFPDKVQVFIVGYEPPKTITSFFKNNIIAKKSKLPVVTGDSFLRKLFPHHTLPHDVWIGPDGIVKAITDSEEVTESNIRKILSEREVILPEKKDLMTYSSKRPLLDNGNGGNDNLLLYRSTFLNHIEGLFSGYQKTLSEDSTTQRLTFMNTPLLSLYYASGMKELPYANYMVLDIDEPSHFFDTSTSQKEYNAWSKRNSFCYEITIPAVMPDSSIYRKMVQDINNTFGLHGRIEKRTVNCYALVIKDKKLISRNAGKSMKALMGELNYQLPGQPLQPIIVDETAYTGLVDKSLAIDNNEGLASMRKALQSCGMDIIPVIRNLPVFVISRENKFILH